MSRALALGLALAAAAAAASTPLTAQGNRWERQVRSRLTRALAAVRPPSGGASRPPVTHVAPLNTEEADTVAIALRPGVAYDILGVCDDDCSGLQIVLTSATGNDLVASRRGESLPMLRFTPTPSQAVGYRLKVVMGACGMNPCWYGVAVQGH